MMQLLETEGFVDIIWHGRVSYIARSGDNFVSGVACLDNTKPLITKRPMKKFDYDALNVWAKALIK